MCHGSGGSSLHAPPLDKPGLRHGDSDLALYTITRDGIKGTAMAPVDLAWQQRWQVVAYVRSLQAGSKEPAVRASGGRLNINIADEQLRDAGLNTDGWLTYSGTLLGHRYTTLHEITPQNVSRLRLRWAHQMEPAESRLAATPLVADNVIFVTTPPAGVVAIDALSGTVIWQYQRNVPADLPLCCGRVNRGLALRGSTLYFGSLDGHLVALDANSGRVTWEVRVADPDAGATLTGAPLIVNDLVLVGVAGSEYGIRGYLAAYDASDGRERWRFHTIPEPGQTGHETWETSAWRTGGGATWNTGSFDPDLGILYWGVGNPAPAYSRSARPGDNLFTNSVIALEAASGKLLWHFQFTPSDDHDWDSAQTPILADLKVAGRLRKLICWPNRNGFYYVLDRVSGQFLSGTPFVALDWTSGLDAKGRPLPPDPSTTNDPERVVSPSLAGATNWQNPAFDQARALVFVHAIEGKSVYTASWTDRQRENGLYYGSSGRIAGALIPVVRALDAVSGAQRWEYYSLPAPTPVLSYSGLLATNSGLLFGAAGGHLFALNSVTGQEVWRVPLGGDTIAPPISFTLGGKQAVAIVAGRTLFVFSL